MLTPRRIHRSWSLALTLVLIGVAPALAGDRTADAIRDELKAIRPPEISGKDREDAAKLAAYRQEFKDVTARRAALIGELLQVDPTNPQTIKLAGFRWRVNSETPEQETATMAEIEDLLKRNDDPALAAEAAYFQTYQALGKLGTRPKFADMMPPIESFVRRFPADRRGQTLLSRAAARLDDPAQKAELLQRIERDYADSPAVQRQKAKRERETRIGKPFELEFTDAINGSTVAMKQLKGQVVVVDFWATWCGPCVAEMPRMKELYAKYHPEGVEFIGVSLDQPKAAGGLDKLKQYVADNQIPWPQYYQGNFWDSEFSMSWGINSIPTMFLVDANGNLASVEAREDLEKLIPAYLAKAKETH